MSTTLHKVIIVGSGPAGLTAAIYTARAGLSPLVLEGKNPGGQLMSTTLVENWPGERSIMGPQLMIDMRTQAQALGATLVSSLVKKITRAESHTFLLTLDGDSTLYARSIIIATGATSRRLGCPGEAEYFGKGVTTCAICDGAFYKDQPVIIVGGGDTAMESASFMLNFTNDITIVQNHEKLTASLAMQERIIHNPTIKIIYGSSIDKIEGNGEHISKVRLVSVRDSQQKKIVETKALFLAIGLNPNTFFLEDLVELLPSKHIKIYNHTHTSVPGIFAAGDVGDAIYRQAITSAGSGCMAALDVEKYLKESS